MGFFFANSRNKPKKPAAAGPRNAKPGNINKARMNAATLNRLGCKACPLAKGAGNQVNATHGKKVDVFFLGEKPNDKEEKKGKPFLGKAGKVVKESIPDEYEGRCGFGNVVLHKTPDNRDPEWTEIECCRGYVTKQIEEAKPKLIVGVGLIPLQWVLNSSDLQGMRGRIFTVKIGEHVCWFMPTYHPDFIIKTAFDPERPLQGKFGHAFRYDVEKAFEFLDTDQKPVFMTAQDLKKDVLTFSGDTSKDAKGFKDLIEEFRLLKKYAEVVAVDLETYPLRPFSADSALLTASLTYRHKGNLRTFAFALHHPKTKWTKSQLKQIQEEFESVLADDGIVKVAQNAPFELEWLMAEFGTGFVKHGMWEDTMAQAHVLDERKGPGKEDQRRPAYQDLNFLFKQHFGFALKSMFQLNKKDMRKTDIHECLLYNGTDTKGTLMLHERQEQLLEEEGLLEYFDFIAARSVTVALMQRFGIDVDQEITKKFSKKLTKEIKGIEEKIEELKVVKKYIADKGSFNPHSQPDVLAIFKDYLKAKEIEVKKPHSDKISYSVDKQALQNIDHPLVPALLTLRNKTKLKSTYVDEFLLPDGKIIYPDGKLHTSYNTTFTTSGRLSSDGPNLQNFPKRNDRWVREQVVAPPGHVLVSIDYGQLEWCVACICCKDKVMVDATWKGYDVHMVWAEKIAKQWPELIGGKKNFGDAKKMKDARGLVKNKMVFPIIFGATEKSIAGYLNMPDHVANRIFEEFWSTFTGLSKWQKKLMKGYYENGYVETLFGRRRRCPMTKQEAINFPIQGTAADIVVDAMDRLSILACETEQWHLHPRLNIHDDLTFVMPDKDSVIEDSLDVIIGEMLAVPYDFVNVPMSVEVSIGTNWENPEDLVKVFTTDIGRH